jgi:predicted 3-demethylubiquinone-9 3-methyltransferase (glyoxalase superfamily)
VNLLPNSSIESLDKYGANDQGAEGTVKGAIVLLAGTRYRFFDSPVKHASDSRPRSRYSWTATRELIEKSPERWSRVALPWARQNGFSQWFCWLQDRWASPGSSISPSYSR